MVENKTPKAMPQNPSNIYRISLKLHNTKAKIPKESYKASIVIDGKSYDMVKEGKNFFTFDYEIGDFKHKAAYYFDISYVLGGVSKTYTSRIYELNIINRYVVGFECNRGRPHAQISLLGRGFAAGDTVEIGEILCDTEFVSPNVLAFTVPFIEGGKHYKAILKSDNGNIGLGNFSVDAIKINAEPSSITMKTGDRKLVTISIDVEAPEFGLPLEITTDIPDSIVMHDVTIRGGEKTANVVIAGGEHGSGTLFIGSPGFEECEIPVFIQSEDGINFSFSSTSDLTDDFTSID